MAHSFRRADHLPKRRGDRGPDPYELPRQRRGITPQMHGRYPDFDVLAEADHWDEVTREVVLARTGDPPPIRFFTPAEAATLRAFCDDVTAQDADPRIPVLAMIDRRLHDGELDGYRYAGMPDDRDTWRIVARGLDFTAGEQFGAAAYAVASPEQRGVVCGRFAGGDVAGGPWADVDTGRAWSVVTRMILSAFYSHPWAWNEIGYAGPAYPRGFARLGIGQSETWEAVPPPDADPDPVPEERRGRMQ